MRKISSTRQILSGIYFRFGTLELNGSRRRGEGTDEAMCDVMDQSLSILWLSLRFLQFDL